MWIFLTGILYIVYFQCGLVSLLVLPILSLDQWQRILHSQLLKTFYRNLKPWIYVYVLLMACFLLHSLRVTNKSIDPELMKDETKLLQYNLNQTLAQRNLYISTASIFLLALIRRLILMKMTQAEELVDFLNIGVKYLPGRTEIVERTIVRRVEDQEVKNMLKDANLDGSSKITNIEEDVRKVSNNFEEIKSDGENIRTKAEQVLGVLYEQSGQNLNNS